MVTPESHHLDCARRLRWQGLAAAGDPAEPSTRLLHEIAEAIASCCHHSFLKSHRLACGWTVASAIEEARKVCPPGRSRTLALSDRSWKEWEAGTRPIDLYRDLLCRLFRTGPVQLGFAADYSPADEPSPAEQSAKSVEEVDKHRRSLMLGGIGLAMAIPLSTPSGAGAMARSGQIGADTADDMRTIAAGYRRSYRCLPASHLLAAARGHLGMALALKPAIQNDRVRMSLVTVVGEMAALAAVLLLLDQQRRGAAIPYIDLAMRAGEEADSPEIKAIALAGRSFAATCGEPDAAAGQRGLDYAELAWTIAETGASELTRGWVAAVASERHAALANEAACRARLEDARSALARADGDETHWSGIGSFDSGKLLGYEGGDLVKLGRYREAEPLLDAALDRLAPAMRRHRCTALVDRAEARLGVSEIDGACEDALLALQLAVDVEHSASLARIETLATKARVSGSRSATSLWREVVMVSDSKTSSVLMNLES